MFFLVRLSRTFRSQLHETFVKLSSNKASDVSYLQEYARENASGAMALMNSMSSLLSLVNALVSLFRHEQKRQQLIKERYNEAARSFLQQFGKVKFRDYSSVDASIRHHYAQPLLNGQLEEAVLKDLNNPNSTACKKSGFTETMEDAVSKFKQFCVKFCEQYLPSSNPDLFTATLGSLVVPDSFFVRLLVLRGVSGTFAAR